MNETMHRAPTSTKTTTSHLEVAIFGLVAGLYALISLDGESTWLEGVLLCAFYLILGVGTFVTPA
jgi:Ca2+:H+ antiporter